MQSAAPALLCTVVAFILFGSSNTQSITQSPSSVQIQEGESVTLDCRFTLSYTYYVMSWFRQLPNGRMTEITYIYSDWMSNSQGRYSVSHQKGNKAGSLTIPDLRHTDSGTYFCAVGETPR
uniref:Ig-like domain-containing protein n=1 Tax=Suricata suricatta TaxID=37032 RepID=A0A673T4R1_SURSU